MVVAAVAGYVLVGRPAAAALQPDMEPLDGIVEEKTPDIFGRLHALDLSFLATPVIERSHGLITPHTVSTGLRELKRFFHLCLLHRGAALTPSQPLDEVWHQAILHSRWYSRLWADLDVPFLEHDPKAPHDPPPHDGYARTLELYREIWGEPPAEIWGPGIIAASRILPRPSRLTPVLYGGLAVLSLAVGLAWRKTR